MCRQEYGVTGELLIAGCFWFGGAYFRLLPKIIVKYPRFLEMTAILQDITVLGMKIRYQFLRLENSY
ncbi:hypothetical protein IJ00_11265 [Calothrix sp. 336/3]|nr:hypothetical protein IJ00_11265 [Calothrix sp. 336/3]